MINMNEMLVNIAKAIVDEPDKVSVNEIAEGDSITLELSVSPDDMGKVIGKHGKIAHAIRLIMKTAASLNNQKVNVEIK